MKKAQVLAKKIREGALKGEGSLKREGSSLKISNKLGDEKKEKERVVLPQNLEKLRWFVLSWEVERELKTLPVPPLALGTTHHSIFALELTFSIFGQELSHDKTHVKQVR